MKNVRKTIVTVAAMIVITLFVTDERRAGKAEELLRAAVLHLLADLLDDVVLALEEPEPAAAVRQVVHVVRQRLDEAVHLVDQLRDERRADRRRRRSARSDR